MYYARKFYAELYMSATTKASVKHVPLRHALDRRLAVGDLTVRACHSGNARTTLVYTFQFSQKNPDFWARRYSCVSCQSGTWSFRR